MAVVINSTPGDVGFVKNKIVYSLTTDRYLDNPGVLGKFRLEVITTPEEGDSFNVAWDDFNVNIQVLFGSLAQFNADTSNTVIWAGSVSSKQGAALAIKARLDANVIVASNFTLAVVNVGSDYFVEFTQKSVGRSTRIRTLSTEDWHEWTEHVVSVPQIYDGEFYVVSKIFIKNASGDFEYLTEILTKPLLDQSLQVDLAEKLKAAVDSVLLPPVGLSTEIRQTGIIKEYQVLFFEKKPIAIGSMQPVAAVNGKSAWFAGFKEQDFAEVEDPFENWIAAGKKWLTWQPNNLEVRADQEHFLSFINYDTSTGLL